VDGIGTSFFGGVNSSNRANCMLLWQWTGGSVSNTDGLRLDQVDGQNFGGGCE
jgi:hypothetical protein